MRSSSFLPGIPPSGSSKPARVIKMSSEVSKEFVEIPRFDALKSTHNIRVLLRELNSSEVPEKSAGIAELRAGTDNMLEPRKSSPSIGMPTGTIFVFGSSPATSPARFTTATRDIALLASPYSRLRRSMSPWASPGQRLIFIHRYRSCRESHHSVGPSQGTGERSGQPEVAVTGTCASRSVSDACVIDEGRQNLCRGTLSVSELPTPVRRCRESTRIEFASPTKQRRESGLVPRGAETS